MIILINGTNLNGGGGAQVADSICTSLAQFQQHYFVVVLSSKLQSTSNKIRGYNNVSLHIYDYPQNDWWSLLTSRNSYLDSLVESEHVDVVFTVFAPMKWKPRVPHLAGFALSHLVMPESPYFQRMNVIQRWKWRSKVLLWKFIFNKTDYLYTENPFISERVQRLFPFKKVFTVTNYYNQVFDHPEEQIYHKLPDFDGWQILNVGSSAPHKNLSITIKIARFLHTVFWEEIQHSEKPNFRFLFTIKESELLAVPDDLRGHFFFIDKVDISEVPSLYDQADVLFQPTLLECFSAVYPEAMRMGKPIVTTDLEFAHGLCGESALYYVPTDPESAAKMIVELISKPELRQCLINKGKAELQKFDDYNSRSAKLIALCERIAAGM